MSSLFEIPVSPARKDVLDNQMSLPESFDERDIGPAMQTERGKFSHRSVWVNLLWFFSHIAMYLGKG